MKKILNWESREVVNIFDEVTLWSAPFGRLLLENIPMKKGAKIADIGFGTGFPLIELSQRFGENSKIYGIDIWEGGITRTKEKINTLELRNIEILNESASKISMEDNCIDLVTSNLGVNNFDEKDKVYAEIKRILKPKGRLCITTNPIGTFSELFDLFHSILIDLKLEEEVKKLSEYIEHRKTKEQIVSEFEEIGLTLVKSKSDTTNMRFVDAQALLNHSLMRIGFREYWENMVNKSSVAEFFKRLTNRINDKVEEAGEFSISIPMLYLEFIRE